MKLKVVGMNCKRRWKGRKRGWTTKSVKQRIIMNLDKRGRWSLKEFAKHLKF